MTDPHVIDSPALPNLRDPGDWPTADGGRLRRGIVYRSAAPSAPAVATDPAVAALGLTAVIDMRTAYEAGKDPDRLPAGARLVTLDVLGGDATSAAAAPARLEQSVAGGSEAFAGALAQLDTDVMMRSTYRSLVSSESALEGYARFVRTVLDADGAPVLYHCTAGKDRTGWATALLMTAVGATPDAVRQEYLAVRPAVTALYAPMLDQVRAAGIDPAPLRGLVDVDPSYLAAAFDQVDTEFGGFPGYLRDGLGLDGADLAALRGLLVAPGS